MRERQELLKQLVDIQDKLRSGEQEVSFLSVDIVGSTRMKQMADPLSVEFTFTEYHKFVEMIARRSGDVVASQGKQLNLIGGRLVGRYWYNTAYGAQQ